MSSNDILSLDSGLYRCVTESGQLCFIQRQKGIGYIVNIPQGNGWYEVQEYNEEGILESATYEK